MVRKIRAYKHVFGLFLFLSLCILFYYSLKATLHKYKDSPISLVIASSQKLSSHDEYMKRLYENSLKWSSYSKGLKMKYLLENPIYAKWNMSKAKKKKKVTILLVVSSGPKRFDRRQAIRETWWTQCKVTGNVVPECIFFTDRQQPGDKYYENLLSEYNKYGDIQFQPLRGGVEFGMRFLYHLVWAMNYYEFDYFLRSDDDYFLCFERFLLELPQPMQKEFHWGFVHCISELVRPEESLILLSRDLVEIFLSQPPQLILCHPLADQMIGVWVTGLGMNNLYRHDYRLHHAPIVDQAPHLRNKKNICRKFIGIHGTYSNDMHLFWQSKGMPLINKTIKDLNEKLGNLITNSEVCELVHNFNYLNFEPEWQYEPQRCIYNPLWDTGKQAVLDGVYIGRQDDHRLAKEDIKNFVNKKKSF
ncbi:lactosylceramide 1,3-N-acetyl-beta-D-glucosaminyltransferase [Hydra vulgaris]|uniref:lactosylceramide 1,3-N-acetyl-beta-D-glucosaminyltransferase n=1 Tax=Hydra vulgaris TaxID=6087 RepID=UPI0032EA0E9A